MEEIEYVTEYEPDESPPASVSMPQLVVRGVLLGAVAGLGFLGWETAVTGWLGLQPAVGMLPVVTVALYVTTGLGFGALAAFTDAQHEAHWGGVAMCLAAAWLIAGQFDQMEPGRLLLALVLMSILALLVGVFGLVRNADPPVSGGVAVGLGLALAALLPINEHLLLTPATPFGLALNGGVVVLAVALGGLVAMVLADDVVDFGVLLGIGAAVGWAISVPVLRPADVAWPEAGEGRPLVLLVVSGLRADHVGVYGNEVARTPVLDEAATSGVVYANATAASSATLSGTASLLTGRLPSHHDAGRGWAGWTSPLSSRPPVLAEELQDLDYATVALTTSPRLTAPHGLDRGFDVYDDRVGPAVRPAALMPLHAFGLEPPAWPAARDAESLVDRALAFVQSQHGGGWFLMVHLTDPLRAAGPAPGGPPPGTLLDDYDRAVTRVDEALGRLLPALPEQAVVVITADHGVELDERRPVPPGVIEGTRVGHSLYQEMIHVPLIVLGPDLGARWVERPISVIDLAPTALAVIGEHAAGMDGQVLLEVAEPVAPEAASAPSRIGAAPDEPQEEGPPAVVAEATRPGYEVKAARRGRYKLILDSAGEERLFDLQLDPYERSPIRDLDREKQALIKELRGALPAFRD